MIPRLLSVLAVILVVTVGYAQDSQSETHDFGFYVQGEKEVIPLPLASTKVTGTVRGFVARVEVTQVYVNPYSEAIEATYVFPLPENAAVHSMIMRLADREVIAEIKPRQQAEQIYERAVAEGHTAALMTQERPNIFTQKVGNIPSGDKVEVVLSYVEALPYQEGVSSFVFPTVVGPRFIPGAALHRNSQDSSGRIHDTDVVGDASRITPPALGPKETSAHRIQLELLLDPGLPIRALSSPSHLLEVEHLDKKRAVVRLAESDNFPNKDFILKVDVRGEQPQVALLAHRQQQQQGYLTLAIQPPALPQPQQIAPKDLFFVVDNSGSMHGRPLEAAKSLVREALRHMNPDDRFTIMRFSDAVSALSEGPLENNPTNVEAGVNFINRMAGMGGTHMLSGVQRALEGSPEPGRVRIVFFLTDGYIGNDSQILDAVKNQNYAHARLFSLGVGSSVNRSLLAGMARLGRGEMQVMRHDQEVLPFVQRFYGRVRNPVLTDIHFDWGDLEIEGQTPEMITDLFDLQPLLVHARYNNPASGTVTLKGYLGGELFEQQLHLELPEEADRPAVASLWARTKITTWMDQEASAPGSKKQEITQMALQHSLISKYTAFVAVDRERVVREQVEPLIPLAQRLPLPEGVSRRALGSVSRRHIPPGDPIISVAAHSDAKRVTAYFPFGLVKPLYYDATRATWRGRFLVPAGIPDGDYVITVAVELDDGSLIRRREHYHLDSQAQEFVAVLDASFVVAGGTSVLLVDSIEPAAEVYMHCPELGWERVTLEWIDGVRDVDWETALSVPEETKAGSYTVLVVVRDLAGNRVEQTLTLYVLPGLSPVE